MIKNTKACNNHIVKYNLLKYLIFCGIIIFGCILLSKNADANVIFELDQNTSLDTDIIFTNSETGETITVSNMLSVTIGQNVMFSQISNLDDILNEAGLVYIEKLDSMGSFSNGYIYIIQIQLQ